MCLILVVIFYRNVLLFEASSLLRYNSLAMFFGSPVAGNNGPIPASNTDSQKLITAIRDQTEGVPPHMVYVIDIVSVRFGGYFTADVKAEL